tara:strand:+ start:1465 stop:1707 length:243 start_codon:yes stop_codon:yes gene_type:complete
MMMINANTPQPVILVKSAIVNELLRIHAPDVQGEQSVSMVQAKVVDPRYEPQNSVYETEYNGFAIALGPQILVHTKEGNV